MDVGITVPIGNIKIAVRSLCDISRMVERLIELGLMALAQTKTHSAGAFAGNDFMGITIHQQDQVIPSDENSMRVTK